MIGETLTLDELKQEYRILRDLRRQLIGSRERTKRDSVSYTALSRAVESAATVLDRIALQIGNATVAEL